MRSSERSKTSDGADFRVSSIVGREVLPAWGDAWTVVQQDRDVDAHDGDDAAAVQVHHEEVLEVEGTNLVVHNLYQTKGKHQQD